MRSGHQPPKRVLVVLASAQRRGAEIQGEALTRSLAEAGFAAEAVALSPGDRIPALDVPVLGRSWRSVRTLLRLRRRMRGAMVIAHGSSALPAVSLASLGVGCTWWYRSIGDPSTWARGRAHRWRTAALLWSASKVIALWDGAADSFGRLYRVPRARLVVIPNDRVSSEFRPAGHQRRDDARRRLDVDGPTVLFCGALTAEKQPLDAVEVVAGLDSVTLLVAGDGPLAEQVRRAGEALGPNRVRLLGVLPDVREAMDAADVLLLTSSTEGMPGVVIEALMAGVPVVATDVGAVRSMLEGVTNARCCRPGDMVGLRAAVAELLEEAALKVRRVADPGALARFEHSGAVEQWVSLLDDAGVARVVPRTAP